MKTTVHSKRTTAFTLVELIICIGCIVGLLLVILPLISHPHSYDKTVVCSGNLKQLGLSVRMYAIDNEERFPWTIPVSEGGTKELAEPFLSDDLTPSLSAKEIDLNQIPDPTGWYRTNNLSQKSAFSYHFIVMSNEIINFRLLICPSDLSIKKKNINAQDMLQSPDGGRYNISYFINLETVNDSDPNNPNAFLFGDRGLYCSRFPVMTNNTNPILFQRGTDPDPENFSDVHGYIHGDGIKAVFADAHVEQLHGSNRYKFHNYIQSSNSFNRIVLPFGKRP
jgi:competence protein ComGC